MAVLTAVVKQGTKVGFFLFFFFFFSFQVRLFLVSYRWALVFDVAFLVATSDFTFRLSAWYVAVCALRTWVRLFFAVLTVPEKSAERAIVEVQNIAPPGTQFLVISEFFVEWALFPGEF